MGIQSSCYLYFFSISIKYVWLLFEETSHTERVQWGTTTKKAPCWIHGPMRTEFCSSESHKVDVPICNPLGIFCYTDFFFIFLFWIFTTERDKHT